MRKAIGEDRVKKEWCYGMDLKILESISYEGEDWQFIQRIIDDSIGDCFLISSMGRVFDCSKQEICENHPDSSIKYLTVSLPQCPEGFKNYKVHRLVALAFVTNPSPDSKPVVHHVNCDRTDNRAENLLWVSQAEHKALHTLKNTDELQYYLYIAELRKEQPVKEVLTLLQYKAIATEVEPCQQ